MPKQPDFGQWFHLAAPRRVHYVSRNDENFMHDMAYLSSYLHDSRFFPLKVRIRKEKMVIPLVRSRWELLKKLDVLPVCRARLCISPVADIRWEFKSLAFASTGHVSIAELSYHVAYDDEPNHLILQSPFFQIVALCPSTPVVRLDDMAG